MTAQDTSAVTGSGPRRAWGWGLATVHESAGVLDTAFPAPELGTASDDLVPAPWDEARRTDPVRGVRVELVRVEIDLDAPPADTSDAYLRLHLLSHRLAAPRTINLEGIFGVLPNVVWTSRRALRRRGLRDRAVAAACRPGRGHRARRRQVPADGRLRRAPRGADRRRRPGPPRGAPRRGHDRDARGLRQLQRRHPGHVDGRGPDLRRRRRRAATPTSVAARR